MNREILFRGKRVDNGEWIYGNLTIWNDKSTSIDIMSDEYTPVYAVIPETVEQYIEKNDKNNKKIFSGNICRFREWDTGDMCWIGFVHFEQCQYIISGGANKECPTDFHLVMSRIPSENIEIIGDIHDNPELLKE